MKKKELQTKFSRNWFVKGKMLILILFLNFSIQAQTIAPFQMPQSGNDKEINDLVDFYHFSSVSFDSQNRPYGMNVHEEYGVISTLRNGLWVKKNYLDDIQAAYPGDTITYGHKKNGHHPTRIVITSNDCLYATMDYAVNGSWKWAILYSDDLESDSFDVIEFPGVAYLVLEEFTGHNLKNGETPAIMSMKYGAGLGELGWTPPSVSWTISCVHKLTIHLPYVNNDGSLSFNDFFMGDKLGAPTIHSGGCAIMATKGNKTYVAYSGFDEVRAAQGHTDNINRGYIAELIRPNDVNGVVTMKTKFMGVQSVYDRIDSHSQGSVVFDSQNRLHYMPGNHADWDYYTRSINAVTDSSFDITNDSEWMAKIYTTNDGDYSYDTPVIDSNDKIHFTYRQRNSGSGRGLCIKSASSNVTNWGTDQGELVIVPPAPYKTSGDYIILYHRLVMDRVGNPHVSSGFFEFITGADGEYPRIGAYKPNGNGNWTMSTRYNYLENIIGGKNVQQISFHIDDQRLDAAPITLNASTNSQDLSINYEVISGPASIQNNQLMFTGTGQVKIRAYNDGNNEYYADEVIVVFNVNLNSIEKVVASEDAFVRDGDNANVNTGTWNHLTVKKDGFGYNRQAFLKFNLPQIEGNIKKATLKLTPYWYGDDLSSTEFQVLYVSDDSWSETAITYNNKPSIGKLLSTIVPSTEVNVFDITNQVKSEMSGDKILSVALQSTTVGSGMIMNYYSLNNTNVNVKPVLEIEVETSSDYELFPESDTYVRNGTYASINYGASPTMTVKKDDIDWYRESFLRFDLSSVSGDILNARLCLKTESCGEGIANSNVDAKFVVSDNWNENTMTWNTKPVLDNLLDTESMNSEYTEWDITDQVIIEAENDQKISIGLQATVQSSSAFIHYGTKESIDYKPVLKIIIGNNADTTSLKSKTKDIIEFKEVSKKDVINDKLFPNPFDQYLQVTSADMIKSYRVYDIAGKQLLAKNNLDTSKLIINTQHLVKGLYIIQLVKVDGIVENHKIKKQ